MPEPSKTFLDYQALNIIQTYVHLLNVWFGSFTFIMVHEIISQALTQNFTSCCFHNDWSNNSAVCLGLYIIFTA